MKINRLNLAGFRVFEQAEFIFQPGLNLLVGINGSGKSSVLDSLCVLLSRVLPRISKSKSRALFFDEKDIRIGFDALTAELRFEINNSTFDFLAHMPREEYIPDTDRKGLVRGQAIDLLERYKLIPDEPQILNNLKSLENQAIVLFFSTRRSVFNQQQPSAQRSAGGVAAAFADALKTRESSIRDFAEWWLVQKVLAEEIDIAAKRLEILNYSFEELLPNYRNLRAISEPNTTLLLDKNGTTLDVSQLSDGERSIIAIIFDIGMRLIQANPQLNNPLEEGRGVILIDEIDLHLHPTWQRMIVKNLTKAFPNCQFVATTHSPQIIGEVSPDNIILLENDKPPYRPDQALGMDANWILEFLMGTHSRNKETEQELENISDLIEEEKYEEAQKEIDRLRKEKLERDPELIMLQTRLDRLLILGNDKEED